MNDYKLRRFNFGVGFDNQFSVEETADGKWVAWDSVEPILRDHSILINLLNKYESFRNELERVKKIEIAKIFKET
jgi:hypothetical protein